MVLIGLTADLIALGTYFGAIHTSPTGSNFYVNGREFLAWVLVAILYSIGLINAYVRRRWRRKYGDRIGDHSVLNLVYLFTVEPFRDKESIIRSRNFKRDFSFIYVVMFPITFLFSRAISATNNATGLTSSPWGDVGLSAIINVFVALVMMIITSMFDFSMSMFLGDQIPEKLHSP
jgi:hypothetical protein